MNIFNKVTLQSMKKSRTRTIVTIIGVVLSAAMITAVATFGTSLLNFLLNGSIAKYGAWHIEFVDIDAAFGQDVDPEILQLQLLAIKVELQIRIIGRQKPRPFIP